MPFFGGPLHHIGPLTPSLGPSATLAENFHQGFQEQYRVESAFGFEAELLERYNDNLDRIRDTHGEDLYFTEDTYKLGGLDYIRKAAERELGEDVSADAFFQLFDKKEARIAELKEIDPEIKSFAEILEEVREMQQGILDEGSALSGRSGFLGLMARMGGSIAGSFSHRDPILVGSLFFGGAGVSVGRRMLMELLIGSGTESVQQFGFVQPTHALLDREGGNPWLNIAAAGLGSAAFRGALDTAVPAYRAVEERLYPQRALGRALNELVDGPMSLSRFDELMGGHMSNPTVRALRGVVDADEVLRTGNPYGNSVVAQRQFLEELEQTHAAFDGRAGVAFTETVLPPLPRYARELDFERALAESEFPREMARVVRAEDRLAVADQRIAAIENEISSRTVADAVELIDPPSAERLRMIEQELQRPGAPVARLEGERDMIIESLGEDAIAKAENDWRIGPRRQLRDARRSRQAAARERARAQRELDGRITALRQQDADVSRIRELLGQPQTPRLIGAIADEARLRMPEDIRVIADRVEQAEPKLDEVGDAIVERNFPETTTPRVEGLMEGVDVDLPENLPGNMEIPVLDDAGLSTTMRAADAMAELNDDRALVEAMRTCAL